MVRGIVFCKHIFYLCKSVVLKFLQCKVLKLLMDLIHVCQGDRY